jgi:PTH1 family peptidyl-tRNA hydrolase
MFWRKPGNAASPEALIVGLGNPEPQYAGTRHNVGFFVVNLLAERWGIKVKKLAYLSLYGAGKAEGKQVGLLKPQTYMNDSGKAVVSALKGLGLEPSQALFIYDDLDLPLGALRLRPGGSSGGHRGIESVIKQLGSREAPRLRLGIGAPPEGSDAVKWVLGRFSKQEIELLEPTLAQATEAVISVLREGFETAMNRFNSRGMGNAVDSQV